MSASKEGKEVKSGEDKEVKSVSDKDNDDVCCVCHEEYDDNLFVAPCKHKFHRSCLYTWLDNNRTCPLCRGEILNYSTWYRMLYESVLRIHRIGADEAKYVVSEIERLTNYGRRGNYSFAGKSAPNLLWRALVDGLPWKIIKEMLLGGADIYVNRFSMPVDPKWTSDPQSIVKMLDMNYPEWIESKKIFNQVGVGAEVKNGDLAEVKSGVVAEVKNDGKSGNLYASPSKEELKKIIEEKNLTKIYVAVRDYTSSEYEIINALHHAIDTGDLEIVKIVANKFPPRKKREWPNVFPHPKYARDKGYNEIADYLEAF